MGRGSFGIDSLSIRSNRARVRLAKPEAAAQRLNARSLPVLQTSGPSLKAAAPKNLRATTWIRTNSKSSSLCAIDGVRASGLVANWLYVGQTAGQSRMDSGHQHTGHSPSRFSSIRWLLAVGTPCPRRSRMLRLALESGGNPDLNPQPPAPDLPGRGIGQGARLSIRR